ncbi:MAG: hypothetical protein KF916_07275 [Microbacteriaceae bacterium]|nr:hypothetical protein [Microbacteriaceae bacterium]
MVVVSSIFAFPLISKMSEGSANWPLATDAPDETALPSPSETPAPPEETTCPLLTDLERIKPTVTKTKTFKGKGNKVIKHKVTGAALVVFECPRCTYISLSTNNDSYMLNQNSGYKGNFWINVGISEVTSKFEIKAKGSWTLQIKPVSAAKVVKGDTVSGKGDTALLVNKVHTLAKVTRFDKEFIAVWNHDKQMRSKVLALLNASLGANVEEIELCTPSYVQVTTDAKWKIEFLD